MRYVVEVDANELQRVYRVLRKVAPDLTKELRQELNSELKPLARAIASKYPTNPGRLYGFYWSYDRWDWGKVVGSVRTTYGKRRGGGNRDNLVAISMGFKSATPYALDMMGRVGFGSTPQAEKLYQVINRMFPNWPNGGRIFYKPFKDARPNISKHAENIINRWSDRVTKELS